MIVFITKLKKKIMNLFALKIDEFLNSTGL